MVGCSSELVINSQIISLGNPSSRFGSTRHNAGHIVLRAIQREMVGLGPSFSEKARAGCTATVFLEHPDIFLFESGTFMNDSATAVKSMLEWQRSTSSGIVDPADNSYVHAMLVLHDDLDLELGEVKFKAGGLGSHGHNGLRSILEARALQSAPHFMSETSFPRVRIGIGRPTNGGVASFVLKKFKPNEMSVLESATIPGVIDIITQLLHSGVLKSFSK